TYFDRLDSDSIELTPLTRQWVIGTFKEHHDSDIEMDCFRLSFFPRIRARGEEILFPHKGGTDVSFPLSGSLLKPCPAEVSSRQREDGPSPGCLLKGGGVIQPYSLTIRVRVQY